MGRVGLGGSVVRVPRVAQSESERGGCVREVAGSGREDGTMESGPHTTDVTARIAY